MQCTRGGIGRHATLRGWCRLRRASSSLVVCTMLLKIHPQGIEQKQLDIICNCLEKGGVIIYPTDTVYAFACKLGNLKASEKLASLKGKKFEKSNFSIVCNNISQASDFIKPLSNDFFRVLKHNTPGAFTFVFEASSKIPKILQTKKKTIGIRIPDSDIAQRIVELLDYPILTSSLPTEDMELEEYTNPEIMEEIYDSKVDIIIDNGIGGDKTSTVIDFTCGEINIIREGIGELVL